VRAARRARRDRARPHRPGDARAAYPRDRSRRLVGRARVRRGARDRRLRLRDHRGDRRAPPRGDPDDGRDDRRVARGALLACRRGRPHVLVRPLARRARARDHTERRPPDPAREGRAACRLRPAHGALRHRRRGPDPPRRCIRRAHRPGACADPRARPRLQPRAGDLRGERGRDGRTDRPAEPRRPRRDRGRRPPDRKGRDGGRAALPGALRRGDGDTARRRPVRAARAHGAAPEAAGRVLRAQRPRRRERRKA